MPPRSSVKGKNGSNWLMLRTRSLKKLRTRSLKNRFDKTTLSPPSAHAYRFRSNEYRVGIVQFGSRCHSTEHPDIELLLSRCGLVRLRQSASSYAGEAGCD